MFFSIMPVLLGFIAVAAGRALDVWVPPVTAPTAASVWPQGSAQNVTWCVAVPCTRLATRCANHRVRDV